MSATAGKKPPVGVVFLNLGSPESAQSVRPFLKKLFSDPDILPIPSPLAWLLRPMLAEIISRAREKKSQSLYHKIGGTSPLNEITRAQVKATEERLNEKGEMFKAFIAMRYSNPSSDDAVREMRGAGIEKAVVMPLYPQYSKATTGSGLKDLERAVKIARVGIETAEIKEWYDDSKYLDCMAMTVREALETLASKEGYDAKGCVVIMSAHSIPMKLVREGDPYPNEIETTAQRIMQRVGSEIDWHLSYQSRTGPIAWLGPDTRETIKEVSDSGIKNIVLVPISFVSDHVETLEEMDMRLKEHATGCGISNFVRARALNTDPGFIAALSSIIERKAKEEKWLG